jgi:glycosyltransferase involved in cell wall biosynthesis
MAASQQPRARRLLIVTYHLPPSAAVASYRMLGFARHLPAHGWRVGFVAPPLVPGEPRDDALLERMPAETAVFPAPYPNSMLSRLAFRFVYNGVWLPRALAVLAKAVHRFKPDVVLTSGPPHCVHVLGLLLKRLYGLPWAACFRDPWSTNGSRARGWFPWAPWERYWERRVVRAADLLIANTPLTCEGFRSAFPGQRDKISFVTNGFDPDWFPATRAVPRNDRPTILHAGELYQGRDPRPFLDALQALERERPAAAPPLRLRLLGQATENRFDLRRLIEERGLGHVVELNGQVPYAEALDAMTRADVLLLLDTPGRKFSIPAKLFEYLGAGRPVLALAEQGSDAAWALETSGAPHRLAPPKDAAAIRRALTEIIAGLGRGTFAAAPPEQLAVFTRAHQAGLLAAQLNTLLALQTAATALPPALDHDARQRPTAAPAPGRPHYVGA